MLEPIPAHRVRTLALLLPLALIVGGCSRQFYRRQVDREAGYLVREKSVGTPWEVPENYTIQPDPRSRFFDPTDPDFPTLPPAGPNLYSYKLPSISHRPSWQPEVLPDTPPGEPSVPLEIPAPQSPPSPADQPSAYAPPPAPGVRLVAYQEPVATSDQQLEDQRDDPFFVDDTAASDTSEEARIQAVKPMFWEEVPDYCRARMLEFDSIQKEYRKTFGRPVTPNLLDDSPRLNFDEIFEVALLNNRDYQTQKESLYRAALSVSLERYAYVSKFSVGGNGADTTYVHNRSNGTTVNTLSVPSSLRGDKVLSTAGTVVGQLANDVILTFNGPNGFAADVSSELLFNVTQRVLQRDIVLDGLIQSERDLVYAARRFARFRKEFLFDIAQTYYSLLLSYRGIEIQSQNYFSQVRAFQQGQEEVSSGLSSAPNPIAVNQFEERVLTSRRSLIRVCNSIEQSLDGLKISIGLPTETPLNLNLKELSELTRRDEIAVERDRSRRWRDRLENLLSREQGINHADLLNANYALTVRLVAWLVQRRQVDPTVPDVTELRMLRATFRLDATRLEAVTEQAALDEVQRTRPQAEPPKADPVDPVPPQDGGLLADPPSPRIIVFQRQLDVIAAMFELIRAQGQYIITAGAPPEQLTVERGRFWELEHQLDDLQKLIDKALDDPNQLDITSLLDTATVLLASLTILSQDLDAIAFDQPPRVVTLQETQRNSVELLDLCEQLFQGVGEGLPAITISADDAMITALVQRLDLMNERGQLADSWRNIKIAADELRSVLDLNASQVIRTEKNRPFDFTFRNSQTRLGLTFDLPLNRRSQRNLYRRALIDYNASLRGLQLFEDNIKLSVRTGLRDLGLAHVEYPINIAAAALAKEQVFSVGRQLQLGVEDVRALDLLDALRAEREALLAVATTRIDYIVDRAQLRAEPGGDDAGRSRLLAGAEQSGLPAESQRNLPLDRRLSLWRLSVFPEGVSRVQTDAELPAAGRRRAFGPRGKCARHGPLGSQCGPTGAHSKRVGRRPRIVTPVAAAQASSAGTTNCQESTPAVCGRQKSGPGGRCFRPVQTWSLGVGTGNGEEGGHPQRARRRRTGR